MMNILSHVLAEFSPPIPEAMLMTAPALRAPLTTEARRARHATGITAVVPGLQVTT